MSQFLNTLEQIVHSDSVRPLQGILRHSQWQLRKLLRRFPCELPIAGSHLYVDRPGGVAALVNAMGEYDYNNMELLRLVLSQGKNTFFDIGANIGSYTLIASESQETQVVSIEPHPATFVLLRLNVELNARENVHCLNLALSDEEGEVLLSNRSDPAINGVLGPAEKGEENVPVKARRFDQIARELEMDPDFIKVDVEGHEESVLDGFGKHLGEAKMIFIERGDSSYLSRVLQGAGYSGPWFCHFKRRVFSRKKQARAEDPIYLGPKFLSDLREMKFVVG
jgi:FkbM family methyltransferase